MIRNKTVRKTMALFLILVMASQIILPNVALALTTGPSQPEVMSFEPVGTTDMVDMFTGDFVYNIPLLDVEGYPVNISYHGGVSMEQEASWVGLGWNINPGTINRTIRGIPDDFNGDTLFKELHIKDEETSRVGIAGGIEWFGVGDPKKNGVNAEVGMNLNFSNYRGMSADFNLGGGVNISKYASAGINFGVGSQTGFGMDYNTGFSITKTISKDISAGVGMNFGSGYNTRSGLSDLSLTYSGTLSSQSQSKNKRNKSRDVGSFTAQIPIGIKNFVPVITNKSTMVTTYKRIKLGFEHTWGDFYVKVNGMGSRLSYDSVGSRKSYGYFFLQNADESAILDFTRDKDGMFNRSMQFLPPGNMTYDIYSVSGQGTGGNFRPFRNDFGSVYDPKIESNANSTSLGLEAAIFPDIFEAGGDYTDTRTDITAGPWTDDNHKRAFVKKSPGWLYEDVYFKQGGELTEVDPSYYSAINGTAVVDGANTYTLPYIKPTARSKRDARGNLISYFTGRDVSMNVQGIGFNPNILSYTSTNGFANGPIPAVTPISRSDNGKLGRKDDHIAEIVQLQKDGSRYVYGIAAMNNIQKEVTFSVDAPGDNDLAKGLVRYTPNSEDSKNNSKGLDNYYSATVTPSNAHSYLLTSVLSTDYVDVSGNGPTDDDLGSFTKFNYTRKESDYRWKAPFDSGYKAQYNAGFWSDPGDDRGNFMVGSREEWMLHSVETKNFVAEFYTSKRNDALGCTDKIITTGSGTYNISPYNVTQTDTASSYKLDSIKLFNKHDRFINKGSAVPIKTVFFIYDYTLCHGVPNFRTKNNATQPLDSTGKLTLKRIYVRYGNSERSMISPYQFDYSSFNPNYNLANKDRWGEYKSSKASFPNYEFPYVDQNSDSNNIFAGAWSLSRITLPSGGVIEAQYESDDYAFVQDLPAAEMFKIEGVGKGRSFSLSTNRLYDKEGSPYLYIYFKRRLADESSSESFKDRYFKGLSYLYYNFSVNISDNSYEQVKGYAQVDSVAPCPESSDYGFIKIRPVNSAGDGAINPITLTALNLGRYNLPHIIYKGFAPNGEGDLQNILNGLGQSFEEMASMFSGPISFLISKNKGKNINIDKSFVRLSSVGLKKQGGGQRVKSLSFYDSWNKLAGGNTSEAVYGKNYDYTIKDYTYGNISSGVASYEPLIGGDENPFRNPAKYTAQSGNIFPPIDPVELYQETPIGETLFPPAVVGYRQVTVSSIHAETGRSSQGTDIYQFYTAKDYPALVNSITPHITEDKNEYGFFSQSNFFTATQGYTLTFNDMHGKPKSIEHSVNMPSGQSKKVISYQQYNYKQSGGKLDNQVNCLVYDSASRAMVKTNRQLGLEIDLTIDSRKKDEITVNQNASLNLNTSFLGSWFFPLPVPIPWVFYYQGRYENRFQSAVVTKVVQQYGIVESVLNVSEGASTLMTNEYFDPLTGQPVVTSIDNEFRDKEYNVDIPAYWGHKNMGPAFTNIGFEREFVNMPIGSNLTGMLFCGNNANSYNVGDELLLTFTRVMSPTSQTQTILVWVMDIQQQQFPSITTPNPNPFQCALIIKPRYPTSTTNWVAGTMTAIHTKVLRSGRRNQLNDVMQKYATLDSPVKTGQLPITSNWNTHLYDTLTKMINLKAWLYSDTNLTQIGHYVSSDTLNLFAQGAKGVYRVQDENVYINKRTYGNSTRNSGLFQTNAFWNRNTHDLSDCDYIKESFLLPSNPIPSYWTTARKVSKMSPYGKEVENIDAVGNYSSAVYGYNHDLPVAVASNSRQGEILADGFEDYFLLRPIPNLMHFEYSPFKDLFPIQQIDTSKYGVYNDTGTNTYIISKKAHTGFYSLKTPGSGSSGRDTLKVVDVTGFQTGAKYLPFTPGAKKYILSYWVQPSSISAYTTTYSLSTTEGILVTTGAGSAVYPIVKKSNIIDGWQQVEVQFTIPDYGASYLKLSLLLPLGCYVDDIRLFPAEANMKSFVYNPVNEKLMATLDENNFATLYEYDQEGNLVRTKKETEKGIMTVSESRSQNPKKP